MPVPARRWQRRVRIDLGQGGQIAGLRLGVDLHRDSLSWIDVPDAEAPKGEILCPGGQNASPI